MEELKLLIEMVANLPAMAMWVLVGFFAYKVIIIGSIYGLIRFIAERLFLWATKPELKEIRPALDGMTISGNLEALVAQLHRVRGRRTSIKSEYIHGCSVDWLREAIDAKIEAEAEAEAVSKKGGAA